MTLDWTHFTPWTSFAGSILIGVAAAMLALLNGRIAGISGIVGGLLTPRRSDIGWRLAFVAGLFAAPLLMLLFGRAVAPRQRAFLAGALTAGLIVTVMPAVALNVPANETRGLSPVFLEC